MGADDRRIDDWIFEVWVIRHRREDAAPREAVGHHFADKIQSEVLSSRPPGDQVDPRAYKNRGSSVACRVITIERDRAEIKLADLFIDEGLVMPILALNHVQLAMPEGGEEEARRFYSEVLGIREVAKPPHLAARGGCWFEQGNLRVHLGVELDFRPARKAHPAFTVSDLSGLIAKLKENGFAVLEDEPLAGYDRWYAFDPFDNRIELMQPRQAPDHRQGDSSMGSTG